MCFIVRGVWHLSQTGAGSFNRRCLCVSLECPIRHLLIIVSSFLVDAPRGRFSRIEGKMDRNLLLRHAFHCVCHPFMISSDIFCLKSECGMVISEISVYLAFFVSFFVSLYVDMARNPAEDDFFFVFYDDKVHDDVFYDGMVDCFVRERLES